MVFHGMAKKRLIFENYNYLDVFSNLLSMFKCNLCKKSQFNIKIMNKHGSKKSSTVLKTKFLITR